MAIAANRMYNDPALGAAFSNLAGAFAPPSGSDLAGYAQANLGKQKHGIIAQLAADPQYAGFDHQGILAGLFAPNQSFRAVEMDDATKRYGHDTTAATSRANNADDNTRAIVEAAFGPLSQGQVRPEMPGDIAGLFGLPELPQALGLDKPLSETEVKGGIIAGLPAADQTALALSDIPLESIIMEDGSTQFTRRPDAVGRTPAPSSPLVNIGPNGEEYGSPGAGLVWARTPEGKIRLDERGAPVAIPFQGGGAYAEEQARLARAEKGDAQTDLASNIVLQDIERALQTIEDNPMMTTGLVGQHTSGVGGTPAADTASMLRTVQANLGFDKLQQMRDSSPTGGALGQVTEKELAFLQAVFGDLQQSSSDGVLQDNLKRLKNVYLDTIHGEGQGPARERLSFPSQWDQFAAPSETQQENAPPSAAVEYLRANPGEAAAFDEKYGAGAAAAALSGGV